MADGHAVDTKALIVNCGVDVSHISHVLFKTWQLYKVQVTLSLNNSHCTRIENLSPLEKYCIVQDFSVRSNNTLIGKSSNLLNVWLYFSVIRQDEGKPLSY